MDEVTPQVSGQYAVRNPWGEVDPVPLRGINPRVPELAGKTIGLFATNAKIAARPILEAVERRLAEREPTAKFSWFLFDHNANVAESEDFERFKAWAKGVDAAVVSVGD